MSPQDIKLHIGGTEPRAGWSILNIQAGPGVDYVGNCTDLSFLADASCAEVYASHVLEHLGYNGELQDCLKDIHRVLKPGGRLRVSVPDLKVLCYLFVHPQSQPTHQWKLMQMIFGGRQDPYDVHYVGLTFEFLKKFLEDAGFQSVTKVETFGEFADSSEQRYAGALISLNVAATK